RVNYLFHTESKEINILISLEGKGELTLSIGSEEERIQVTSKSTYSAIMKVSNDNRNYLWVSCTAGTIKIDHINISLPKDMQI
ncbi:MAG: hypothetical protein K0R46_2304, partial [Herbinix sp.]|nr:hypothetical protein [Herbinix sp.]